MSFSYFTRLGSHEDERPRLTDDNISTIATRTARLGTTRQALESARIKENGEASPASSFLEQHCQPNVRNERWKLGWQGTLMTIEGAMRSEAGAWEERSSKERTHEENESFDSE